MSSLPASPHFESKDVQKRQIVEMDINARHGKCDTDDGCGAEYQESRVFIVPIRKAQPSTYLR